MLPDLEDLLKRFGAVRCHIGVVATRLLHGGGFDRPPRCEGRFQPLRSTGQRCSVCHHLGVRVRLNRLVLEIVGEFVPSVFLECPASRVRDLTNEQHCHDAELSRSTM